MAKEFEMGVSLEQGKDTLSIVPYFTSKCMQKFGMQVVDNHVPIIFRVFFRAVAITLHTKQSKNTKKVGFEFQTDKGEFIFGATMSYIAPEDVGEDDAGNWNLSFTFDKADLDGCSDIIVNHDDVFVTVANEEMHTILNGSFSNPRDMNMLFDAVLDSIVHYLDVNSNDDTEEVTLFMKDIFTATVSFEDGKKVYTCTPGVQIKQLIKDDSKLTA